MYYNQRLDIFNVPLLQWSHVHASLSNIEKVPVKYECIQQQNGTHIV